MYDHCDWDNVTLGLVILSYSNGEGYMEVYFGGAFQGKLDYVLEKKGHLMVADGACCSLKDIAGAQVLNHLHLYIKRFVLKDMDIEKNINKGISKDIGKNISENTGMDGYIEEIISDVYDVNPDIILICDEVGSGIVPLKKEDRIYREAVGRALCCAVKRSDRVERIMCGIGQCLKCKENNR